MRITPLAVYCRHLPEEQLKEVVSLETQFTHCHINAIRSCQAYCLAIQYLLNNPKEENKHENAYEIARNACTNDDILSWFTELEAGEFYDARKNIGFVKIAFQHSFQHLKLNSSHEVAMKEVLMLGGDTDTNACIVGGLIGALHGFSKLNKKWVDSVL